MEDNMTTVEELNATIAVLREENKALSAENEGLKSDLENLYQEIEKTKKDYTQMRDWWSEGNKEKDRLKGCLGAIATLVEAINN